MSADDVVLNPPAGYGWEWVVTLVGSLVLLGVLVWGARLGLRKARPASPEDVLATLRSETLAALEASMHAAGSGELTARSASGRMGAEVRRFVGIVSDGDADFTTLPALRRAASADARLRPAAVFVGWLEPHLFGTGEPLDAVQVHERAVEVVEQWR